MHRRNRCCRGLNGSTRSRARPASTDTIAPPPSSSRDCRTADRTAPPTMPGVGRSARIWMTPGCRRRVAAKIAAKAKSAIRTMYPPAAAGGTVRLWRLRAGVLQQWRLPIATIATRQPAPAFPLPLHAGHVYCPAPTILAEPGWARAIASNKRGTSGLRSASRLVFA